MNCPAVAAFLDALYPSDCACMLCGREAQLGQDRLCAPCREALRFCPAPPCPRPLSGLSAAFMYEGSVSEAIHRFKYQNGTYLAPYFAAQLSVPEEWNIDCIVPVPLHRKKLRKRGYNQSALLAAFLAKRLSLPVFEDRLIRVRDTVSQTELTPEARHENVVDAFSCPSAPAGQTVLLVDDVSTTGATLSACAAMLLASGAERVYAVCVAVPAPPAM